MEKINAWNHERKLEQHGRDVVVFDAITTGNFGGFDVWLDDAADAKFSVETNLGSLNGSLSEIGIEDTVMDAGGLERKVRVFRLPKSNPHRTLSARVRIPLKPDTDNPLWVCVTTEDGFQAWSSPIYAFR